MTNAIPVQPDEPENEAPTDTTSPHREAPYPDAVTEDKSAAVDADEQGDTEHASGKEYEPL